MTCKECVWDVLFNVIVYYRRVCSNSWERYVAGGGRCCKGELREPHPRRAGDAFHAITTDIHDTVLR